MAQAITLDTAVLVQSLPRRGRYRRIIQAFDSGRLVLIVSTEILFEYEEILKRIGGRDAWTAFLALLGEHDPSVRRVDPTYHWRSLADPDDKFVDAAVAGGADWIVTEDAHFNRLFKDTRLAIRPIHPRDFIDVCLPP